MTVSLPFSAIYLLNCGHLSPFDTIAMAEHNYLRKSKKARKASIGILLTLIIQMLMSEIADFWQVGACNATCFWKEGLPWNPAAYNGIRKDRVHMFIDDSLSFSKMDLSVVPRDFCVVPATLGVDHACAGNVLCEAFTG